MFDEMHWRQRKELGKLGTAIREAMRVKGGSPPRTMKAMVGLVAQHLQVKEAEVVAKPIETFRACRDQLMQVPQATPARLTNWRKQKDLVLSKLWGPMLLRLEDTPRLRGLHDGRKCDKTP